MAESPLSGVRVLELCEGLSGAFCSRQFAVWGADVLWGEDAGGHALRCCWPSEQVAEGCSIGFAFLAAGKRALLIESDASESLSRAIAAADVLITDWSEGKLAQRGCDLTRLCAGRPDLVVVHLSPWGRSGPAANWPATELTLQAHAGYAALNGAANCAPLRAPGRILSHAAGMAAFIAALATLYRCKAGGAGGLVEVSTYEAIVGMVPLLRIEYLGAEPSRDGGPDTGVRVVPCSDGWVSLLVDDAANAEAFLQAAGVPIDAWPNRDGFASNGARFSAQAEMLSRYTREVPARALCEELLRRGIVCGVVHSPDQVLSDPHLAERKFFSRVPVAKDRELVFPGPAARLSRSQPTAPLLGSLAPGSLPDEWSAPRSPVSCSYTDAAVPPLAGVKVLDLTQAWLGPYAAMLLGDLGAQVTKIESHKRPDVWRQLSIHPVSFQAVWSDEVNTSPNYNSVNRGKRSLCLNLQTDAGRGVFLRLVRDADLVMENFTPRVLDKFGLGYNALSEVNSRIILASFSGYGKSGPLADFKANGTSIEAMGGWDYYHRYPGGAPLAMGFYQADAFAALHMAALAIIALIERLSSDIGQSIDGSMYEAACGYLGETLLATGLGFPDVTPEGGDPDALFSGVFSASGEDAWLAVSAQNETQFRSLCGLAGLPEIYECVEGVQTDLRPLIADWIAAHPAELLARHLRAIGVPAAAVRRPSDVLNCSHLAARGFFHRLEHPIVGVHRYSGSPWRISGAKPSAVEPPPRLGEHNQEILRELGFSDEDVDALYAADATGQRL